jgi:hypothetical protein
MTLKRMRLAGHIVIWEKGEVHTGLWWEKTEGKISVGITGRGCQDNI